MKLYWAVFTSILLLSYSGNSQCSPKAALDCESAPVFCSLDEMNGFKCMNPDIANPSGPNPLCFGTGVPHNTNWWAFVGNGDFINIKFEFNPSDCTGQGTGCSGIQIGILDDCGGDALDCNANCNTSTIVLSGQTINCQTYFVWVDGCCGDVCKYTISVNNTGSPQLPTSLPIPQLESKACPCATALVCVEDLPESCETKRQWTIDGVDQPDSDDKTCIDVDINEDGTPIEVCLTWTIGNPANPDAICDQRTTCLTIVPNEIEIIEDDDQVICWEEHYGGGYEWRNKIIYSSCINPPCKKRVRGSDGCCIEYQAKIDILPARQIINKYTYFCDKSELPLVTEDGRTWYEEVFDEQILWEDFDHHSCDTSYILHMSFFDPFVKLSQSCADCNGYVTLTSKIKNKTKTLNGQIKWESIWLNEMRDTIGKGEVVHVTEDGKYYHLLEVQYKDDEKENTRECILEDRENWIIEVHNKPIPIPDIFGFTESCETIFAHYKIRNSFEETCKFNWSILNGRGKIITKNYLDSSRITVEFERQFNNEQITVCVDRWTDCKVSDKNCFTLTSDTIPMINDGRIEVCGDEYQINGFNWHDSIIYSNCINPPCKKRIYDGKYCIDFEAQISFHASKQIPTINKYFCNKLDLPFTTEDGRIWNRESFGDTISWLAQNEVCDTNYVFNFSYFDPLVQIKDDCGACDGFKTIYADVQDQSFNQFGQTKWFGYWLNESLDTIAEGDQLKISKAGRYFYGMHVAHRDDEIGNTQECDLSDKKYWTITIEDFSTPLPQLSSEILICGDENIQYKIDNKYDDACSYNWYIKKGNGSILTANFQNISTIDIAWEEKKSTSVEVCVEVLLDCTKSGESCFEATIREVPRVDKLIVECMETDKSYRLSFNIIGGDSSSIMAMHQGIALNKQKANMYYTPWTTNGERIMITYYDIYECQTVAIDTTHDCMDVAVDNLSTFDVIAFPNPANDYIQIMSDQSELNLYEMNIHIIDIQGKTIIYPPKRSISGGIFIDLSHLSSGIYFIQLVKDDEIAVVKVVKIGQ